jgi:hypothetical protein
MRLKVLLGIVGLGVAAAAVGCSGGASDDSGSGEAAASVFDPRVRKYLFDFHLSKAPACATPHCAMQLRLKAYGRLGRVVDDACFVVDFSGTNQDQAGYATSYYGPLQTSAGGRVGEYETNAGLDPASKYSNAGLFGDVNAVEFSIEEGPSDAYTKLDKDSGCFGGGTVRHEVKAKFDETKNAHRSDHPLDIVFGSRVDYIFGQSTLTFSELDCDGKWGLFPECPATAAAVDAGADGGSARDAAAEAAPPTAVSPPPPRSTDPSNTPPSDNAGDGTSSGGDPSADPSTSDPSAPAAKKKPSSKGGCAQAGGPAGTGGAAAPFVLLALLGLRRRRPRQE